VPWVVLITDRPTPILYTTVRAAANLGVVARPGTVFRPGPSRNVDRKLRRHGQDGALPRGHVSKSKHAHIYSQMFYEKLARMTKAGKSMQWIYDALRKRGAYLASVTLVKKKVLFVPICAG